jgi:hypothetical protein
MSDDTKVIFKKDFFNLKDNKIFESALGDRFKIVESLPRVPKPGQPSLVVEEIDVIPNGKIIGTLGGSLVLNLPAAPGVLNLLFCWAGPRDQSRSEWAIITLSCLTDVLGSHKVGDKESLLHEISALLNQETFKDFGRDETPVLLNRLNRAYTKDQIVETNSDKKNADGLMAILLELTGLESFPDKESKSSFFKSIAGEQILSLLTVLGNIKQSFDSHIGNDSEGRRESILVLSKNIDNLEQVSVDADSEEQFQGFLNYILISSLFEGDFKSVDSRLKSLDVPTGLLLKNLLGKEIDINAHLSDKDLTLTRKKMTEVLKITLSKNEKAA